MIDIPYHKDYSKNQEKCTGDDYPCAVCGKPVKTPKYMVRVVGGGGMIGTDADAEVDLSADLGYYPIGQDCLRNNPVLRDFAVKQ